MSALPQPIRVLALDVDGVLTDGTIRLDGDGESKQFHVQDGLGISLWQRAGGVTALISGRSLTVVERRAAELGIEHVTQGSKDKVSALSEILASLGATPEQTAFVGDDLVDLDAFRFAGYAIAVADAAPEVRSAADWTTPREGGHGAVRDAVEHLMKAMGTWEETIAAFDRETLNQ